MFQLSKKVEYALIAIRHMVSGGKGKIYTTKEIADRYQLPYELLAKIMQKLSKQGFITSYQGVNGGYMLVHNPAEMKVADIIHTIEGKPAVTIVQCESSSLEECSIHTTCTIKNPLIKLQSNLNKVLDELTVMEMF
ncbi:MAG: Rrf2 family transcriptional regulator [Bacteroidota bacterium]|nr:Rrf2 family transcriptional regulator [Bacteroidota bacterium]